MEAPPPLSATVAGVPRITTRTATPMAPPTWRAVWLTALPTAKRCGGSDDTAAALSTGKVSPMPRPTMSVPGQPGAEVVRRRVRPRATYQSEAGGEAGGTDGQDRPEADLRPASLPAGAGDQGHHQRPGGDREAGPHDRVVPHPGQEQDVAEQHGEEPGGVDERRQVGGDERALDGTAPGRRPAPGGAGTADTNSAPARRRRRRRRRCGDRTSPTSCPRRWRGRSEASATEIRTTPR